MNKSDKLSKTKIDRYLKNIPVTTSNKIINVATAFSGIGAVEQALNRLKLQHKIIFACDNDKFVKQSYLANYEISESDWHNDIGTLNAKKYKNKA